MAYELLNKDVPVLEFGYDESNHRVSGVNHVVNPDYAPPSLVSVGGEILDEDVAYWWDHRGLPASRDQLDRIFQTLGVDDVNVLVEHNMGLSLTDRYWVRPVGSDLSWEDVNFFDNDFSDDLGRLTLVPSLSQAAADEAIDLMSPNSSVGGNVPKKWMIGEGGTRWLVKAGNKNARQDVYNELVATELYRAALDPSEYVSYTLIVDGDAEFCACPNFLEHDEEFVPACDLLRKHADEPNFGTLGSVLAALGESGLDPEYLRQCLSKQFSLDFLMANADRHTGNFGLIRDCTTLEYKRFAPIFDTGFSLWCDVYSLSSPVSYEYRPRPFIGRPSESADRQLRLFDNYRWLPEVDLLAWKDKAIEILSRSQLSDRRIQAIGLGIDGNIHRFERHIDRMAELFPSHAPEWIQAAVHDEHFNAPQVFIGEDVRGDTPIER